MIGVGAAKQGREMDGSVVRVRGCEYLSVRRRRGSECKKYPKYRSTCV